MIYLFLAIVSSAMVSLTMRLSERHIQNNMVMFAANYGACLALARCFMGNGRLLVMEPGILAAFGLGALSGILYLVNFVILQISMRHNGVVLSSTFMKLGVLVPTVMAVVIFRERPEILQVMGMMAALAAILMIHFDQSKNQGMKDMAKSSGLLLVLLLISGFTDSMANVYDKAGLPAFKEHYLFFTFLAALLASLAIAVKNRKRTRAADLFFGILIGVPNYFSARFLLLALGKLPAVIVYPVYSTATIVLISVVSVAAFREQISRRKRMALFLIVFALILLNV